MAANSQVAFQLQSSGIQPVGKFNLELWILTENQIDTTLNRSLNGILCKKQNISIYTYMHVFSIQDKINILTIESISCREWEYAGITELNFYLCGIKYCIFAVRQNANWPRWQMIWHISKFYCLVIFVVHVSYKGSTCSRRVSIDISLQCRALFSNISLVVK